MATPEPQPNARPTLPEFDLSENVILVTGGARGLGLCMAEAFLQSGATVYALDRLPENERSEEFQQIADRAKNEWGSELVSAFPPSKPPGTFGILNLVGFIDDDGFSYAVVSLCIRS